MKSNPSNTFHEIPIHDGGLAKARALLISSQFYPQIFIFASAHLMSLFHLDTRLRKIALENGVFPDSWYLSKYMKFFDGNITQTRGPNFFASVLDDAALPLKHFLIASSEEELARSVQNSLSRRPNVKIVGALVPPYQKDYSVQLNEWVDKINLANPDVVWIGIGTPNQLVLADELTQGIACRICCVGAAFSFYAGAQIEAPRIFQQIGAEWIYRLSQEPRRLFIRYAKGNTIFLCLIIIDFLRRGGLHLIFRNRKN